MNNNKKVARPMGHGPMAGMRPGEKAKDFKGTFKKLFHHLSEYRLALLFVMICAALSTVFAIIGPSVLGDITTVIFEGLMNIVSGSDLGMDFDKILKMLMGLGGLYLFSAMLSYGQGWIMTSVIKRFPIISVRRSKQSFISCHSRYYDRKSFGEVLSHMSNDVDTLSNSLSQSVTQIITSVTMIIGILFMMLRISWQMTIVALLVLPRCRCCLS